MPARPTTVAVPKQTKEERARTVVSGSSTLIRYEESTARSRRRDAWILRGACAVPSGRTAATSLAWTVGGPVSGDTTDVDVLAAGQLTCGTPEQDIRLPALHGRAVQVNVSFPDGNITSAYLLIVPRR